MPVVINSNIDSLRTQRQLGTTSRRLERTFDKLSSGLRINRASDDAAGLAVASLLQLDSRIHTVGIRNVNDAASLYTIAEGALTSLSSITTRLAELAEQSANGTLSGVQRAALNSEAQSLAQEYRRITWSTSFNGASLFDDRTGSLSVQVGYSSLDLSAGLAADGSFKAPVAYASPGTPYELLIEDFNSDGITDLGQISILGAGQGLTIFLGNSDGSFRAGNLAAPGSFSSAGTADDFNGDGKLDVISGGGAGALSILIGNGDGTFKQNGNLLASGSNADTADINNDGKIDLVLFNGVGVHGVYLGNGNGTFKFSSTFATSAGSGKLLLKDLNQDGNLDLIAADSTNSLVNVSLGNGDGTFRARTGYASGTTPSAMTMDDMNGDGVLDVVVQNPAGSFGVLFGSKNGTFGSVQLYNAPANGGGAAGVSTGDFNGDGRNDIVISQGSTGLNLVLGNGDGTFKAAYTVLAGSFPSVLGAKDLNDDGILDIIAPSTGGLNILLGNGSSQDVVAPSLGTFSLLTKEDSLKALTQIKTVIQRTSLAIGNIGANQSRLEVALNGLSTSALNFDSASSQIMNTDVAEESANLTRLQILQQAGVAILTQANIQPQLAISLLT